MPRPQAKSLLVCEHAGVLLKYTEILNVAGFFQVTPCSNFHEARDLIWQKKRFDYLFYDGFNCASNQRRELLMLRECVAKVVLFAELSKEEVLMVSKWAECKGISILGVFPRPIKVRQVLKASRLW
ncbi:hypothetical protein ACM7XN_25180 [Pseudomonas aeruginosa]